MKYLGMCYEYGSGVQQDKKKAAQLYQQACDLGNASAMYILSRCYFHGFGVSQDRKKAIELCRRAAELGDEEACSTLPKLEINSESGKQNARTLDVQNVEEVLSMGLEFKERGQREKAFEMFFIASQLGVPDALFELACCYAKGYGVKKSKKNAIKMLRLASEKGVAVAATALKELESDDEWNKPVAEKRRELSKKHSKRSKESAKQTNDFKY